MTLSEFSFNSINLEYLNVDRPELVIGLVTFDGQADPPFQPDPSALLRMFPLLPKFLSGLKVSRYNEMSFFHKCYPLSHSLHAQIGSPTVALLRHVSEDQSRYTHQGLKRLIRPCA
jgi:hypothetical protein